MSVLNGTDLLLYIDAGSGSKAQAYATSHSISLNSEVRDTSSKESGIWGDSETGRLSWSVNCDGLYTIDEVGKDTYEVLYDALINRRAVTLVSARRADADIDSQKAGTTYYTGQAIIESLEQNAGDNENVSYSVSFSGKGAWQQATTTSGYDVTITATGATHILCVETNSLKAVNVSDQAVFNLADGDYNFVAYDGAGAVGETSVTVSGATATGTITLA